jgi:hypothetical protein
VADTWTVPFVVSNSGTHSDHHNHARPRNGGTNTHADDVFTNDVAYASADIVAHDTVPNSVAHDITHSWASHIAHSVPDIVAHDTVPNSVAHDITHSWANHIALTVSNTLAFNIDADFISITLAHSVSNHKGANAVANNVNALRVSYTFTHISALRITYAVANTITNAVANARTNPRTGDNHNHTRARIKRANTLTDDCTDGTSNEIPYRVTHNSTLLYAPKLRNRTVLLGARHVHAVRGVECQHKQHGQVSRQQVLSVCDGHHVADPRSVSHTDSNSGTHSDHHNHARPRNGGTNTHADDVFTNDVAYAGANAVTYDIANRWTHHVTHNVADTVTLNIDTDCISITLAHTVSNPNGTYTVANNVFSNTVSHLLAVTFTNYVLSHAHTNRSSCDDHDNDSRAGDNDARSNASAHVLQAP